MFKALRRMIFPIIIIVLVFFVGMIILQWGAGMSSRTGFVDANIAASINGEEIEWSTYQSIYDNLYRAELAQSVEGEVTDRKVREIRDNAWKQLLYDRLMMQEIAKRNLVVTDEEIYGYLRQSPPAELQQMDAFKTNGQFDYQKYLGAMLDPSSGAFWVSVESFVRTDILKLKLQESISYGAHVTESEVKEQFMVANEKASVEMINVEFSRFSSPPPSSTEEELRTYFEDHKDDYKLDARAALHLVMIDKKPGQYDWELANEKVQAIYDSVTAEDADFAAFATLYSEDKGSAVKGGDLGWFAKGRMVEQFDRKAFLMSEGEISEPIRTEFGFHIIKHHGYRDEAVTPRGQTESQQVKQAHASHILIKATASQETLDIAFNRLEEFRSAADRDGFHKAAKDLKMSLQTTGPFFEGANLQFLGRDSVASAFAFGNEEDAISAVHTTEKTFYVAQVAKRLPEGPASFEDGGEKIKIDIVKWKVETLCRDTAAAIYAAIEGGASFAEAATQHGEEVDKPDPFTRNSFVTGLRRDPEALGAAFSLSEPGSFTVPVNYEMGTVIVRLLERQSPDIATYNAKRDSVYNLVLGAKRQAIFNGWVSQLVAKSEIVNNIQRVNADDL